MNDNKKKILLPLCFFVLVLCCFVGISYKRSPYLINITYQSLQDPEEDGVEKIIVSHISGAMKCTTENFEYNTEKERYEYVVSGEENTYLNLYLSPLQTFRCYLEYRLKYEDSAIDQSDGIIVTLYSGDKPVWQQVFSLLNRDPTYGYEPELFLASFALLFFASFVLIMVCVLRISWKKWVHMLIAEGTITAVWIMLWVCGRKTNALTERSVFQKFALLFVFLAFLAVVLSLFRNGVSEGKAFVIGMSKRVMPAILFFVVTCCIYMPSSLFLGNIDEFIMPFHRIVGLIFLYAFISFLFFFGIGLSIYSEKGQYIYSLILFFLTMGFYIQSNFLNPQIPELNGGRIEWDQFAAAKMYSDIGWGSLCVILLILAALAIWKNFRIEKPLRYLSVLLILMQICSLGVMVFTCRVDPRLYWMCGKEGQFTVGDDNVIVFLVDSLQVDAVQTYIDNTENADSVLENFTLFTNVVGGGAPTDFAVPLLLTGEEYDPAQDIDEYYDEIYQEGYLLKDLQEDYYDVRLYTEVDLIKGIPAEFLNNIIKNSGNRVNNGKLFMQKLLQLSNLYMMPLSMKESFWFDANEFKEYLTASGEEPAYSLDNVSFYEDFQESHLQREQGKSFRLYHLKGVHESFANDEKLQRVKHEETDEKRTFRGVMLLLQEYMEELKALGVYDNSTIVIMGDHGRHNSEDALKYPAILLKRAGENHPLQYSDNPVCFRNLVATIGSEIKEDYTEYGPGLFDVNGESDVQRLQTLNPKSAKKYAGYNGKLYEDSETGVRFVVDDGGTGNLTYREWNPYEINRVQYNYGDVIDFGSAGGYADGLTDRLYPAENGKTASNELTICFDLPDQKTGDLELGFTYAGVYNDAQKIRIYANGHKVDNVICATDQIGKETSVVIPKQFVKDKPVIVRMVFPNAVTPNQLDRSNDDTRVLSVTFDKMWLKVANS